MEPCKGRIRDLVFIVAAVSCVAATSVSAAAAAAPAGTVAIFPAQDFNLSSWRLQLPVASNGSVLEISSADLMGGYTSSYFSSGTDHSMTFWCPVTGGTTLNSHYPRSELRETASGGDWSLAGHHEFSATCRVLSVPSSGRVIIGQIHGHLDGSEIIKLEWDNGNVYAAVEPNRTDETHLALGSYKLGDSLKYRIEMTDGILKVTLGSKSVTYSYTAATWKTDTYYFKAGSYVQDNEGASTEGAKVAFYALAVVYPTGLGGYGRTRIIGGNAAGMRASAQTGWGVRLSGVAGTGNEGFFDPAGKRIAVP